MSFLLDPSNWDPNNPQSITIYLVAHVDLVLISLAFGLIIAFPLALIVARFKRFDTPITTTASVIYTIPSLALMPLLIPLTGLTQTTVLIVLTAYTQVVLIRNISAAISGVDPTLVDAARGMGMSNWQIQRLVVLPLALPVIMAGVRIVTVTSIGIATFAPEIGVDTLGTLIFQGFNFHRNDMLIGGSILIIVLAIGTDLALLGVQMALSRGRSFTLAPAS